MQTGVTVAVVRNGMLLLGRRLGSYGNGTWQMPGGKPDAGETIEAAALRELFEETRLVARSIRRVAEQVDVMPETRETCLTHFVVAEADGEPENREPHKCAGWFWFVFKPLPAPLFAIDPSTLARVRIAAR